MRNITVVRSGALGDTILTVPALRLLHRAAPRARITLVGSRWAERVAPLTGLPLQVVRFDDVRLTRLFTPLAAADPVGIFRKADLCLLFTPQAHEPLVENARRLCFGAVAQRSVHPPSRVHAAVHFARAVGQVPSLGDLPFPGLQPPAAGGTAPVRPGTIAIHPGSGGRRKCWPPERFAALARPLLARERRPIGLVEGPADAEPCCHLLSLLPHDAAVTRLRHLDIAALARALVGCSLYVGNDSGISHLAAGLGVPTVAVFGPTDPRVWRPHGPRVCAVGSRGDVWPDVQQVLEACLGSW